jgi:geranylgeranyl transferase type-1 subunit beta
MTLAYFCLGALDVLDLVEAKLSKKERNDYIDWIYDQQLDHEHGGGFCSSPYLPSSVAKSNLAMTYTALLNLAILRDDFARLDKAGILSHLHTLQHIDGRYVAIQPIPSSHTFSLTADTQCC